MSEHEGLKGGDRIVRDGELRAVRAKPEGEDRPVYVVVDTIDDEIIAMPEPSGAMVVADEDIAIGDPVVLSEHSQVVWRKRQADRVADGIAVNPIRKGEAAIFDVTRGRLYRKN